VRGKGGIVSVEREAREGESVERGGKKRGAEGDLYGKRTKSSGANIETERRVRLTSVADRVLVPSDDETVRVSAPPKRFVMLPVMYFEASAG
jgi:hypothetical protein